jgi:HK97 gp10 family phage protein
VAFTQPLHLTVHVDGLDGILDALEEIPKIATEKNVVRRALVDAAEPIRAAWSELAPYDATDQGLHLRDSVVVSTKTASKQGDSSAPPGGVTVFIGPRADPPRHHGIFMEFGTFKDIAQPSGRPAYDSKKYETINLIGFFMWVQIDATAQRLSRRAARLAQG